MIAPPPPRRSWRRWGLGVLACAVLLVIVADRLQTTIRLPSGAVIVIDRVTYGRQHDSKPPLLARAMNRMWGVGTGQTGFGTPESDSIGIWMSCRTRWLHRPANFEDVFEMVLIDRDGWPHGPGRFEEYERTWNGNYGSTGQPVDLDNLRRGSSVVSFANCPVVRPDGAQVTVAALDKEGRVLGTAKIPYPGPPPPESDWTPDQLPATKTDGGLSVTLQDMEFAPPPPIADGATPRALRGVSVVPKFEVRWKGKVCSDCRPLTYDTYLGQVFGPLDGYAERVDVKSACDLSPFEPAWEWRHHFYPGPTADFDEDDLWRAGEFTVPARGQLVSPEYRGRIGDLEYGLESLGGPGEHSIEVPIGKRISLHERVTDDGSAGFSGRRMPQNSTIGTYDVYSEAPFLIVSSPPIVNDDKTRLTPSFHAIVRNVSGDVVKSSIYMLSWVQWTHDMPNGIDDPREYWIIFLPREARDIGTLNLTIAQYRVSFFSFYFRPPGLEFYRQHNLLPLKVAGFDRD